MTMTGWIPIHRYRLYRGWLYTLSCGHHRYDINAIIIDQSPLHCYHCERPRVVTRCIELSSNLGP